MESLGKELDLAGNKVNQGIAVYGNKGSTDQHAYVQQLRDGVYNFFLTFHRSALGPWRGAWLRGGAWRDERRLSPGLSARHAVGAVRGGPRSRSRWERAGRGRVQCGGDDREALRASGRVSMARSSISTPTISQAWRRAKKAATAVLKLQSRVRQALGGSQRQPSKRPIAVASAQVQEKIPKRFITFCVTWPQMIRRFA